MNLNYIIKRPIITEKSLEDTKRNCYTFEVDLGATKDQIKVALKQLFKVDAVAVRTSITNQYPNQPANVAYPVKPKPPKKRLLKLNQANPSKYLRLKDKYGN